MNDVSALFEIFPICQKFLLNTIDIPSMDLTKTQILILFALSGGRSLNMSQLSSYLASSKEQATRAVSPLVKDEYVTRFRSDENRKMVYGGVSITSLSMTQKTASLGIPMGYIYIVLPITGIIITLYGILNIIGLIRKGENA